MASLLWRSMTSSEQISGDIAICLSDTTSFATEWQPSEAALEGMSAEERDGNARQVPVLLQSGRALDDELVEGQVVEL